MIATFFVIANFFCDHHFFWLPPFFVIITVFERASQKKQPFHNQLGKSSHGFGQQHHPIVGNKVIEYFGALYIYGYLPNVLLDGLPIMLGFEQISNICLVAYKVSL